MMRVRSRFGTSAKAIALRTGHALFVLCMAWCAPDAHAYPMYDDGAGNGCVSCHDGFQGGNGPLHFQHRTQLGITTCNVCHSAGGGSTPVRTYWSGPGGGFGCAGCHGQDYGETSPDSGEPKATSYGLRRFHVNLGITACGSSGCHRPGALGSPNPFPTLLGENVPPPYYKPMYSRLTNPCSSADEDMPFDADPVGLDNDGDGLVDAADPDCAAAAAVSTTTTTDEYDHDDDPVRLRTCSGRRLRRSRSGRPDRDREEDRQGKAEGVALEAADGRHGEPVRRPGHGQDDVQALHLRRGQPAEG